MPTVTPEEFDYLWANWVKAHKPTDIFVQKVYEFADTLHQGYEDRLLRVLESSCIGSFNEYMDSVYANWSRGPDMPRSENYPC